MRSEIALKDNRIDDLTRAAIGEEIGDRLSMLLPGQSERLNRNTRADRNTEVAQ
jgi:hypothetical protein